MGITDGTKDGTFEGKSVGVNVGMVEGKTDGASVGILVVVVGQSPYRYTVLYKLTPKFSIGNFWKNLQPDNSLSFVCDTA